MGLELLMAAFKYPVGVNADTGDIVFEDSARDCLYPDTPEGLYEDALQLLASGNHGHGPAAARAAVATVRALWREANKEEGQSEPGTEG